MTPTVQQPLGIDISHWQPGAVWGDIAAARKQFAYIKATEGTDYTDPDLAANWNGAHAAGLFVGAYHFLSHDLPAQAQANHFLHTLAGLPTFPGIMPVAVDVEPDPASAHAIRNNQGGAVGTNWPASHMVKLLDDWLTYVRIGIGYNAMIYTYPSFWRGYMGDTHNYKDACPLWLASYPSIPATLPGGWSVVTIHQYSASGQVPGVTGRADLDRFNGSSERLAVFAGVTNNVSNT